MPVTLTGPAAPLTAPLGLCAVCAAAWKAACFTGQGDEVARADADPAPSTIGLHSPGPLPPPAVAYGLAALPGPAGTPVAGQPMIVPLPLCWTHLTAVQFTGSSLVASAPIPELDGRQRRPGGPGAR
jgi:hypothetical protein